MRIIGYERDSTARQGASGLGLEAQRQAIEAYAAQRGANLVARFTEVESGRNADRPELGKARHLAKVTWPTLVIAKLDRLSRNVAFLLTLRDGGVRFSAVDLPEGNDLTVGPERDQEPRGEAGQLEWRCGPQAGWEGRCAAAAGDRPQRGPACAGPDAGFRGHPG
jgi:hypothetical protein